MANGADSFDIVAPQARSLIESLRAFSYDLATALSDLVDNSITAEAQHVWIDFDWNGESSIIAVTDDGNGMSEAELVAAMRPGSRSPIEQRDSQDLGRFGLGLKTASFSQSRRVGVRSKRVGCEPATRCWDLDHVAKVDQWQLLRSVDDRAAAFMRRLETMPHGTSIVWQKLDRVTVGHDVQSEAGQKLFLDNAALVSRHLGMVFHDLLRGRGATRLYVNERQLEGWDPFLADHPATQVLPVTRLLVRGFTVELQPFILPHHSKISETEYKAAGGPRGWHAHQGFYVYRRNRLLVAGDWLGLGGPKENHYKLARIRVDFPNGLDLDWGLDVTKSRASPPVPLRNDMRAIAERTRASAKRVYTFRGAKLTPRSDQVRVLLWEPVTKHDRVTYRLNRNHPLLKRVFESSADRDALGTLVRLVEETMPHADTLAGNCDPTHSLLAPFEGATEPEILGAMRTALRCLVTGGYSNAEAMTRLATVWPFELYPALIQTVAEEMP